MRPLRVLCVAHTYVVPWQRAKLQHLGDHADIDLRVLVPTRWRGMLGAEREASASAKEMEPSALVPSYVLLRRRVACAGRVREYRYLPGVVPALLDRLRPHVVYVEAEVDSCVLAQFARLKARYGYRLVMFGWENMLPPSDGMAGNLPRRWLHRVRARRARRALAWVDAAIWGNHEGADLVRARGFLGPVHVVPQLGVETEVYAPGDRVLARASRGLAGDLPIIGYVGRLVPEKGLRTLGRALEPGLRAGRYRLLLVGAGPLLAELQHWARDLGAPDAVRLVGAVPHAQVPGYLQALDMLVLPSESTPLWKEQFGHVLIEAMACGVPVIGSNAGAIPEVVGDAGLVFRAGDAEALKRCVEQLLADGGLRCALVARGRARVARYYTNERIASQLYDILRGVA